MPSPATTTDSPTYYAKYIALSAQRRDDAAMEVVFDRHKDVAGGLSKAAFIAALKEVEGPVLFSSDSTSEDTLFGQAQDALEEQRSNTKYQIRKMHVGSTDDFHKGLADRIGKRPVVAQRVPLLTVGFRRVAQSGLRKEHAS
jgi:hypothetical protein